MTGKVFDIQKYSIHDGRGIRTIVFLKGCHLRCKWCSNPESQALESQLMYSESKCIHCYTCVKECPNKEIVVGEDGNLVFDWEKCVGDGLFSWVDKCPTNAIRVEGKNMTLDEVMEEIRKDIPFYKESGGVTFSGGEPLLQHEFVKAVCKQCKEEGITTAIETTGCVDFEVLKSVSEYIDEFLYDFKTADCHLHQKYIGVDNALIIENLKKLHELGADIMVRTPLIPGINDSKESINAILDILEDIGIKKYNVLRFHQLGSGKYHASGMSYEMEDLSPQSEEYVEELYRIIRRRGFLTEF